MDCFNTCLTHPQEEGSGAATPTTDAADNHDFSEIKKKKKKKKAAFDLEAFEKELSESKPKEEEAEGDDAGGEPDGRHLDDINEEDLGEDVFAQSHSETPSGVGSQSEPWLSSDRDYTYQEVNTAHTSSHPVTLTNFVSSSSDSTPNFMRLTQLFFLPVQNATPSPPQKSAGKEKRKRSSPIFPTSADECTDNQSM